MFLLPVHIWPITDLAASQPHSFIGLISERVIVLQKSVQHWSYCPAANEHTVKVVNRSDCEAVKRSYRRAPSSFPPSEVKRRPVTKFQRERVKGKLLLVFVCSRCGSVFSWTVNRLLISYTEKVKLLWAPVGEGKAFPVTSWLFRSFYKLKDPQKSH